MAACTNETAKITTAAEWLEARQAEVLPGGFSLQQVTVHLEPNPDTGQQAVMTFTWQGDHYDFTVA